MKGDGTKLRACTPTPAPKRNETSSSRSTKRPVRFARPPGKPSSRPDLARRSTRNAPDTVWTGSGVILDHAGGHVPASAKLRGTAGPPLFSCGLQGSAASRPRGAPSGGTSAQDLAFLLPYRFRDAKIRTREPARLMPNPCDIFRGGPVRRSPASPRERARTGGIQVNGAPLKPHITSPTCSPLGLETEFSVRVFFLNTIYTTSFVLKASRIGPSEA